MSDLDRKLRETVAYAYANATAVKARFDAAGVTTDDIQTIDDLVKLPILRKDEMVQLQQANPPFGGFLGVAPSQVSHIFFSPGPLYEPAPPADDDVWEISKQMLRGCGFVPGDVVLVSLSYHLTPAGFLFDNALARLGCTVIPGGIGNSDLQLQMMRELGCTGYVGTPSFLMSLIRKAEEQGLNFTTDFKLKKAMVSAEPLPPSLRQTFTETYGIAIANAYGTAEFGILAVDRGDGVPMAMQLLPEPIIQLLDPETGEPVGAGSPGEVVVTNFSRVYPMIRFGTGDMAVNVDPNPGQSRQEERSMILVGRSGEAVKVRGMFVHPNQLRFAASQVPGVQGVQAVVTRPDLNDVLTLTAVVADGTGSEALAEGLKKAVTAVCRLRVDSVEFAASLPENAPGIVDARVWE
ncbi:MAG: AMP-binding protein [Ardenticatenaceae bacterium]|nr:AMP-binding protein [Ardenticatenaceae bacterium]